MPSKTLALLDTIRKSRIKGVSRREAEQIVGKHQIDSLITQGVLTQNRTLARKPRMKPNWPDSWITLIQLGPVPYNKQGVEAAPTLHRKARSMPHRAVEYFARLA